VRNILKKPEAHPACGAAVENPS